MKVLVLVSLLASAYAYSVPPTKSYQKAASTYASSSAPVVVINKNANDEVQDAPPQPYQFNYVVDDAETANRFQQDERSDGRIVSGSYRVALPDGRIQNVVYSATPEGGFIADVTYEGEARYPVEPAAKKQPEVTRNVYAVPYPAQKTY